MTRYNQVMNDTIKCAWCDTMFEPKSGRAKFCSEACKQKNKRMKGINRNLEEKHLPLVSQASKLPAGPEKIPEDKVDLIEQTYDPDTGRPTPGSPGWYNHGTPDDPGASWDRVCVRCGKDFHTDLMLRRFCSDLCFSEVMVVIANGPHANYLKWRDREGTL